MCGFPPFVSTDNQQEPLFDAILSGVFEFPEPYWDGIGDGVRDLINNMLQSEPDLRFSSEDILDHPWLSDSWFEEGIVSIDESKINGDNIVQSLDLP